MPCQPAPAGMSEQLLMQNALLVGDGCHERSWVEIQPPICTGQGSTSKALHSPGTSISPTQHRSSTNAPDQMLACLSTKQGDTIPKVKRSGSRPAAALVTRGCTSSAAASPFRLHPSPIRSLQRPRTLARSHSSGSPTEPISYPGLPSTCYCLLLRRRGDLIPLGCCPPLSVEVCHVPLHPP